MNDVNVFLEYFLRGVRLFKLKLTALAEMYVIFEMI